MSAPERASRVVVAAVGNELRRDDGVGPAVLASLPGDLEADVRALGSPLDLLGLWEGCSLAVLVDAVGPGAGAGSVTVTELLPGAPPRGATRAAAVAGSHVLGVADVVRLAEVLGSAPSRVVLVGVGGEDFGPGQGLSDRVATALGPAASAVAGLVRSVGPTPSGPAVPATESTSRSKGRAPG